MNFIFNFGNKLKMAIVFKKSKLMTETLESLKELKIYLDDIYYNTGESKVSDDDYDLLKEVIIERDPKYIPKIGAVLREDDNIVKLPYFMGSMNKIKPTDVDVLGRWVEKNSSDSYIIEDKLDGVSCLLQYRNSKYYLYTRGDGTNGSDISYLSSYIKTIHNTAKNLGEYSIRGELIIKKKTFERKYKDDFANPRNFVSGRINSKSVKNGLEDIEFIAYEIIQKDSINPSHQLKLLKSFGFKIPAYKIINTLNPENLIQMYLDFRKDSEYEIDGLIVSPDKDYKRNTSGNPKYAFAFKMLIGENVRQTTVEQVVWDVSRWGVIKPKIKINPVMIDGNKITYTTGFNARYIQNNKIGPGTVIEITRSGDVIPYIVSILKTSEEPQFPDDIEYKWNETNVDIIATEFSEVSCVKNIAHFFSKMGIKHVSQATVQKMYDEGYDTLLKIVGASQEEFEKIPGFGERLAERTFDNIHNGLKDVPISTLLGSSGIFGYGMGEKKINILLTEIPDLFEIYKTLSQSELIERLTDVKGFSEKSAIKVVDNISHADEFIKKISKFGTIKKTESLIVEGTLKNLKIIFSGFRDKDLEESIVKQGGQITTSVSKNTNILIVNDIDEDTSKIKKAKELKILIITKKNFIKKYL